MSKHFTKFVLMTFFIGLWGLSINDAQAQFIFGPVITIIQQPVDVTVMAPARAVFKVVARDNNIAALLKYQWGRKVHGRFIPIRDAIQAVYVTPPTTTADNDSQYECVIYNTYGRVITRVVTLTVHPHSIAPSIIRQPVDTIVTAPATATFTVTATGLPTPTYQWMQEAPGASAFTAMSGATGPSYTTGATTMASSGTLYECVVSNIAGSVTSRVAHLTVNEPAPTVNLTSNSVSYLAPATITLTANAAQAYGNITRVDFYNGTTLLGLVSLSPYVYIWNNVSAGNYTLTAVAHNNTNETTTSTPVNISVTNPVPTNAQIHAYFYFGPGTRIYNCFIITPQNHPDDPNDTHNGWTECTYAVQMHVAWQLSPSYGSGLWNSTLRIVANNGNPVNMTTPVVDYIFSTANAYQASSMIFSEGNYDFIIPPGSNPEQYFSDTILPNALSSVSSFANVAPYYKGIQVCGFYNTDFSFNYIGNVCSNIAPLYGMSGPLTPPALVAPKNMTLTPDPVNIATGEAYFPSTDFSLNAQGPRLALFRKYTSFSTLSGMFGYGWRTDFDLNLTQDGSGDVTIYDGDGSGSYFMNNSGIYTPSPGNYSILGKNADNTFTLTDKNGKVSHYDVTGRLMSVTDRNGNALTFVYNPAQVGGTYIQDASGRKIVLNIDSNGHVVSAVDSAGNTFQYGYDVNGNLVSITNPLGAVTSYTYDSNHKITQVTNANGHNTYYQYDGQGRVTMNWQNNNVNQVTLNYQTGSNGDTATTVTDSLGNVNSYVFNNYGLLLSHTDPLGNVIQEAWDPSMNLLSKMDARNNTTNFGYDGFGNVISITDPLSHTTSMSYTSNFNLISSITDALSHVTNFTYDNNGNLTTLTDALSNNHSFGYDQYGNLTKATDSLGNVTNFTYDALGDVLQKTDALGDKTIFTYDTDGNALTKTDALENVTNYQYDKLNRLLKVTFADSSMVSYSYDLFGNQTSVTDQGGNTLTKTYDPYDRLIQTKDPNGGVTQFSYDTEGHLLILTDANGNSTTYTYDANGKLLTQTNPLSFATTWTYDPVGNIATRVDANGKTTAYTYDALNRLTNTAYPDGSSVANVYDALGRKTSMIDSTGQTTYTYDALSHLLTKTSPGTNNTITYTYDSEGNRLTSVDQNNRTITNTYDALNRLASVTDPNGGTTYGYDADSNKISVESINGITEKYTYDSLNRVLSAVNTSGATVISSFANSYNTAGMITKKTYQDDSWDAYTYDALNRLLSETHQTNTSTIYSNVYTYDAVGNRLTWTKNTTLGEFWSVDSLNMPAQVLTNMTNAGYGNTANPTQAVNLARSYTYDNTSRLSNWSYGVNIYSASFPVQTDTYAYDNNGNRTQKQAVLTGQTAAPKQISYAYDFENRLDQLNYTNLPNITGAQTDNLTYSGEGLRVQALINSVASNYLYDGTNILIERNSSGNTTKTYTRGVDILGGIGGLIAQNSTSGTQYYQYDDLGSVANLTTSAGATTDSYSYDAFGNLLTTPASGDTNRYFFSTKEFDTREGLYFFGSRYYDPEIGRWLTQDPLGFAGGQLNLYVYCGNDPVNCVDPLGLFDAYLFTRSVVGLVASSAVAATGTVFAETGFGAVAAVYGVYGVGANAGNIVNSVTNNGAGPTGPGQTVAALYGYATNTNSSTFQTIGSVTDLAAPLIAGGPNPAQISEIDTLLLSNENTTLQTTQALTNILNGTQVADAGFTLGESGNTLYTGLSPYLNNSDGNSYSNNLGGKEHAFY